MVQRYRYRNGASEEEIQAYNVLREFENMGYLAIEELNELSDHEFYEYLETAPMEYLENVANAAKAMGYRGGFRTYNFGQEIEEYPWHLKYRYVESLIQYRNTDKGKKTLLKKYGPKSIRNSENDTDDMLDTATLKAADVHTGDKKKDKKITQLNIQRLEIIKLLEQSIAEGGYIKTAYNDLIEKYYRDVDNLPPDDLCEKIMKSENRQTKIKQCLINVAVLPLFWVLTFFAIITDSLLAKIFTHRDTRSLSFPKLGIFGRYLTFYLFVMLIECVALILGAESEFGDPVSQIIFGGFVDSLRMIPFRFPLSMLFDFLLGVYTEYIVLPLEDYIDEALFFITKEDVRMSGVQSTLNRYQVLETEILTREEVIKNLKAAIRNSEDKCLADNYYDGRKAVYSKKRLLEEATDKSFRFNY